MDVFVKKLSSSKVEMRVSLSWEEWKEAIDHAVKHLAMEVKIAGFRPGKAPRDVIEKRFGKQTIFNEAAEHAVAHSYPKVIEKEKLEVIGPPEVKIEKLAENEMFEYSVMTAVMPEVTLKSWRDDVKKINKEFAKKEDSVSDEEISAELEKLASMRAKLVTVNREAKLGDNVLVDFSVLQNGVLIENGKSEKHPLVLGSGVFIPGFEEQLVGMKANEEKSFELAFPAEYHTKHLAGKLATFNVKINVVQERELPMIDDEFAKGLGNFESLEKLKENLREGMFAEKKIKNEEEHREKIMGALVEKSEIDYPDILVKEEERHMLRAFEAQVKSIGMDFSEYLSQTKKTEDDLKTEMEPQAKKKLATNMILDALAKEAEIDVDSQETEAEMNKVLVQYQNAQEINKKIDMERLYNLSRGKLLQEKTFSWLKSL
jgi:trigger factor